MTRNEVAELIDSLPAERRAEFETVYDVLRRSMPKGYEEVVTKGMLVYQVPLARYPDTYNKQPLMYVSLASQKNHLSLYLLPAYGSPALAGKLEDAFKKAGKKLDMGKSCIRFKRASDLELDAIAAIVAFVPVEKWIEIARTAHGTDKNRPNKSTQ